MIETCVQVFTDHIVFMGLPEGLLALDLVILFNVLF